MEEEIKKIKLSLPYVDETGKSTLREQTIQFKKIVEERKGSYWNNNFPTYKMGMSLTIPTHIHSKLKGAIVPRKRGLGDDNGTTYSNNLPKTLTRYSLEHLTEDFREMVYDYKWLIDLDNMELKKVIFYNFNGDIQELTKSSWDGKKLGSLSKIKYGFMVGYIGSNGSRLNKEKKILRERYEEEYKWKFVNHTEEREIFFIRIFEKFKSLLNDLTNFETNISEKSIDNIIKSQPKLLSN